MARRLAGLAVAAAFAAGPSTAAADTFFVDDSGSGVATDCRDPNGTKCQTITQAINIAKGIAGTGDVISVGPGNYAEFVDVSGATAEGMRIVGAGTSSNTAVGTTVTRPVDNGTVYAATIGDGVIQNLGLSDVRISVPAALGTGTGGALQVKSPGTEVERVAVSMQFASLVHAVIQDITAPGTTFDTLTVTGASGWTGAGMDSHASFTLLDSTLTAKSGSSLLSADNDGGSPNTAVVRRSRLSNNSDGSVTVAIDGANVTIDSSLVFGSGDRAISTRGAQSPTTTRLRGVTVDPGAPGLDADPSLLSYSLGNTAGQTHQASVESSLLIGPVSASAVSTSMACTNSDVPLKQTSTVSCHTAGGNTFTSPPNVLFADIASRDYTPVAGSPAIDTGSAAAPQSGDSATDLAAAPRIVDGNLDCVARIDKGAFELAGQSAACPTVGGVGGGAGGGTGTGGVVPAKDTRAPSATLAGAKTQDPVKQKGVLFVDVTPTEDGTATAAGTVNVPGASKAFKLKGSTKAVRAGRKTRLRLKLTKKALGRVRRALRKRKRVSARITLTLRDAAGNRRPLKRTLRLRPRT
jgi:hypothetical protein